MALVAIGDRGYWYMAISDEIRHQRSKLKGKGPKAYISYFLTYYLWATVGVIAGVAFIIAILTTVLGSKEDALGVMMLNATTTATGDSDYGAMLGDGYAAYAGIDTDEYAVSVDTSVYMTPGVVQDTYDMASSQKVSVQAAAGTLDCIVADASNFYYYTHSQAFRDLRDVLSEETLAHYADHIYYVDQADVDAYQAQIDEENGTTTLMTSEEGEAYEQADTFVQPDPDTMENPIPVGIIVTDAPRIADYGVYTDRVAILGFVQNAPHIDNAVSFLDYLWN